MLSCRKAAILISKSLDGEMTLGQRLQLRAHLLVCRVCSRLIRQLRFQKDAATRLGDTHDRGPALPDAARERIRQRLRDRGEGE